MGLLESVSQYFLKIFFNQVIDAGFLITHFFEDTLKTYRLIYEVHSTFYDTINIVDKYDIACRLVNYFRLGSFQFKIYHILILICLLYKPRYVLRFVSSYTIVAFSIQRWSLVYRPFSRKFKTKKSAWTTFTITGLVSLILNSWALFLFGLRKENEDNIFCDVNFEW